VLDRIDVRLDEETNEHLLDSVLSTDLVNDVVEFNGAENKGAVYKIAEDSMDVSIIIPYGDTQDRHRMSRNVGRQSQIAKHMVRV